jgi:hypothetical protein
MSRVITYQMCGMVLDALYHNAQKDRKDQKSMDQLAKDCGVSINTLFAFRDILINLKILIKEGTSRAQRVYWHPDKVGLNEAMLRNVYNIYVGDKRKREIKKVNKKAVVKQVIATNNTEMSIETAILYLVEQGFTGILSRQPNAYTIETLDLSKIK